MMAPSAYALTKKMVIMTTMPILSFSDNVLDISIGCERFECFDTTKMNQTPKKLQEL